MWGEPTPKMKAHRFQKPPGGGNLKKTQKKKGGAKRQEKKKTKVVFNQNTPRKLRGLGPTKKRTGKKWSRSKSKKQKKTQGGGGETKVKCQGDEKKKH